MKVAYGGSNVVGQQGVASTTGFKMVANAHAFHILSSGLYSDKVSAVLREIGCNAADAHIEAGTPTRPIEVKLPTTLEPTFHIRDWGPGLTHEQVTGLYTTYFSSTKSDSNDYTGAFGLGSKSPFSYTQTFAVTTAKDGRTRHYAAHLDETGCPALSLLSEQPASAEWPHGLMVSFPVEARDIAEFHVKAKSIFTWFKTPPRFLGGSVTRQLPKWAVDTPEFSLPACRQDYPVPARVVMGNVAYPLDGSRLERSPDPMRAELLRLGVHLRMPIGGVQVAASREELQYDPASREQLIKALDKAAKALGAHWLAKYRNTALTLWERQVQMAGLASDINLSPASLTALCDLGGATKLESTDIRRAANDKVAPLPDWAGDGYFAGPGGVRVLSVAHVTDRVKDSARKQEVVQGKWVSARGITSNAALPYEPSSRLYIGDAAYALQRVRAAVLAGEAKNALLVMPSKGSDFAQAETKAVQLAAELGGVPVTRVSSLPVPSSVVGSRMRSKTRKVELQDVLAKVETRYLDLAKGRAIEETRPFAKVPAEGQFFIVRSSRTRRGHAGYLLGATGGSGFISGGDLTDGLETYLRLRKRVSFAYPIDGVLVVSLAELRGWKLEQAGWKCLPSALAELFSPAAVRAQLKAETDAPPFMKMSDAWNSWRCHGVLGGLVYEFTKKTKLWRMTEPALRSNGVAAMVERLATGNTPQANERRALGVKLHQLCRNFGFDVPKGLESMELADFESAMTKAHPLLAFIDFSKFPELTSSSCNPATFLAGAAMLRLAFQGKLEPTGVLKVDMADGAPADAMQRAAA